MARIREYTQQTTVSGEVGGRRATAEDFGSGAAMQQFGETVQNVAAYVKEQDTRREVDAAQEAMSQARLDRMAYYDKQKQAHQPGDMTFAETIKREVTDYVREMETQYKSPAAKHYIRQNGTQMAATFFGDAMGYQAQKAGEFALSNHRTRLENDQKLVAADPSQYGITKQRLFADIDSGWLRGSPRKDELKHEAAQKLAATAGMYQAENDPAFRGWITGTAETQQAIKTPGLGAPIQNFNADYVKPYSQKKIADNTALFNAPSDYDDAFKAIGQKYGVDWKELKLRAVMESSLKPDAKNPSGATGLMQFMPETAKQFGIDPTDPLQSIDAAARLMAQSKGDTKAMDLTYYGGPNQKQWGPNTQQYAANMEAMRYATGVKELPLPVEPPKFEKGQIPEYWGDLSVEAQLQITHRAQTLNKQESSLAKNNLVSTIKDHESVNGAVPNPLPRAAFAPLGAEADAAYLKYTAMVGTKSAIDSVRHLRLEAQQAALEQLTQPVGTEQAGVFATRQALIENATKYLDASNKARTSDPIGFAMTQGFGAGGLKITQIDFRDPSKLADQVSLRYQQAEAFSSSNGTKFELFSKTEAKMFGEYFNRLPVEATQGQPTVISTLSDMRQKLGAEKFSAFVKGVQSDTTSFRYIGETMAASESAYGSYQGTNGVVMYDRDQIANMVAMGGKIMSQKMETKDDKKTMASHMPQFADADNLFSDFVGKGFTGDIPRGDMVQTAMQIYVSMQNKANSAGQWGLGKNDPSENGKMFKQALELAFGKPSQIGTSKVFRPFGVDDSRFQYMVEQRVNDLGKGYSKGTYGLIDLSVGDGNDRYGIVVDGMATGAFIDLNTPSASELRKTMGSFGSGGKGANAVTQPAARSEPGPAMLTQSSMGRGVEALLRKPQ